MKLLEGVKSAKRLYGEKIGADNIDVLAQIDSSPTKKYVEWMSIQLLKDKELSGIFTDDTNKAISLVQGILLWYLNSPISKGTGKDIYQTTYSQLKAERYAKAHEVLSTIDDTTDVTYTEGNLVIIRIRSFGDAQKFGNKEEATKAGKMPWCVTTNKVNYNSYTKDSIFYFVKDLDKEKSYAMQIYSNGRLRGWDVMNNPAKAETVKDTVLATYNFSPDMFPYTNIKFKLTLEEVEETGNYEQVAESEGYGLFLIITREGAEANGITPVDYFSRSVNYFVVYSKADKDFEEDTYEFGYNIDFNMSDYNHLRDEYGFSEEQLDAIEYQEVGMEEYYMWEDERREEDHEQTWQKIKTEIKEFYDEGKKGLIEPPTIYNNDLIYTELVQYADMPVAELAAYIDDPDNPVNDFDDMQFEWNADYDVAGAEDAYMEALRYDDNYEIHDYVYQQENMDYGGDVDFYRQPEAGETFLILVFAGVILPMYVGEYEDRHTADYTLKKYYTNRDAPGQMHFDYDAKMESVVRKTIKWLRE